MKKFLIAVVAGFIPALIATNGANAQDKFANAMLESPKHVFKFDKLIAPEADLIVDFGNISPKAMKEFTKTYKNVTGESWEQTKDGFAAMFTLNGVRNAIYYNTRGRWEGSLKGYDEGKLSKDVRKIVKSEYYDYTITYVDEVKTIDSNDIPTYVIHLEDRDSIKLVRVSDGQMDIWKEYKKQ